jgi:hypothetical protein
MPSITAAKAEQLGIPRKTVQTILFAKDKWTVPLAKKWLHEHSYVNSNYRKTANEIRFLQNFDVKGARFYSKKIGDGSITIVSQQY